MQQRLHKIRFRIVYKLRRLCASTTTILPDSFVVLYLTILILISFAGSSISPLTSLFQFCTHRSGLLHKRLSITMDSTTPAPALDWNHAVPVPWWTSHVRIAQAIIAFIVFLFVVVPMAIWGSFAAFSLGIFTVRTYPRPAAPPQILTSH